MNLTQRSDEEVLVLSVENPEAFLVIFDRHFDRIAAYLARRSDAAQVDELSSEVFVRAFAHRRRFARERAEVVAWLYGIATNVLRENWRAERRQLELVARAKAIARGVRPAATTDEGLSMPLVASAIARLAANEREPLLLYALADLDYAQIAAALEVPVGTVKSRINRAREHLRRDLADSEIAARHLTKEGISDG